MLKVPRRRRQLSLICAGIVALLGVVACGDPPPSSSIFAQQPQQGSGEAIDLQSATQIHPLWAYQPDNVLSTALTSAQGIVYVMYESDVSKVGAGDNTGNITPTLSGGTVSVLDAVDALSGRRLWRFQAPELLDVEARPVVVNQTIYFALTYHVCALNAQSGAVRWCSEVVDRTKDEEYIVDGELAFEDGVLFVGAYHTLIAVDAATGKRVWSAQTPMRSSHLASGDGLIYVSAARTASSRRLTPVAVSRCGAPLRPPFPTTGPQSHFWIRGRCTSSLAENSPPMTGSEEISSGTSLWTEENMVAILILLVQSLPLSGERHICSHSRPT